MTSDHYDEERIARLLRALPPAPTGWAEAAQQLPRLRRELDDIVKRAVADAEFRQALQTDLEKALTVAGYELDPRLLEALREQLESS